MNAHRTWPKSKPADCWDWISPQQLVELALEAYFRERVAYGQEEEDPGELRGDFEHGRTGFAQAVADTFEMLLWDHGHRQAAPGFSDHYSDQVARLGPAPKLADILPGGFGFSVSETRPDIHRALKSQFET